MKIFRKLPAKWQATIIRNLRSSGEDEIAGFMKDN